MSREDGLSEPLQIDFVEGGEYGSSGASPESWEVRTALGGLWADGKAGGPVRARETPWFEMT